MGFVARMKTRNGTEEIIIRGNEDGTVDFVKELNVTDKETGKEKLILNPYKYFITIDSALERIFRMRCNNRDAETIQEILANVKEERELLRKEFEGITTTTTRRRRG